MKSNETTNKTIKYFVNGEAFETEERKLSVRFILENAGFKPADSYKLVRDNGTKELDSYDSEENIHENESFTALFKDPTPVSGV